MQTRLIQGENQIRMDVPEDWGVLKERLKVFGGSNKVSLD
jgi:hypothetical protein